MTTICCTKQEDITVLYLSLKLYLHALNAYTSEIGSEAKQIIIEYVTDLQAHLAGWIQRSDIGFGDHFGGKGNTKVGDEIKVSFNLKGVLILISETRHPTLARCLEA